MSGEAAVAIALSDRHGDALAAWRRAPGGPLPLVHIDAHLDCEAYEPGDLHIGNVVRAAIAEHLVREVIWIVPDPVWHGSRADVEAELAAASRAPGVDVPLRIATFTTVPPPAGPSLLDIDIDYLFFTRRGGGDERPAPLPWLWPGALAERVAAMRLAPAVTTIASSISGGFVPVNWKHLARELALRLEGIASSDLDAYARLAEAARLPMPPRMSALEEAAAHHPGSAAVLAQLAAALQESGRLDEARRRFAEAVAIDPEYRHLYRTAGPVEQARGRLDAARALYEQALALDPLDPFSRIGLAQVAVAQQRMGDAERLFEDALALPGGDQIEACRGLARLLEARDPDRALNLYEQSLRLAIGGRVPLSAMDRSNPDRQIVDPDHAETYRRVASLQRRAGRTGEAAANEAFAAGIRTFPPVERG